jgi:SPOR domain
LSTREQAYERDEHRHDDGHSKRAHDQRDRAEDVTNVADEEYAIEALQTPKRRLVLVIAIFGLAVAGTGVAFGYRAMFGGLTSLTLPPINQTSKGSKEIVRASSDVQANHNASAAGAVSTDSIESLVSHGGSLPGMGAPATPIPSAVGQTMSNQAMPVGLAGGANSPWPPAVTAASAAAAPPATLAPAPLPEARAASSRVHVAAVAPASANSAPAVASYGSGGGYTVQVTAERSESKARAEFRALQAKYRNQLSGRHATIRRADLGTKGTYYRALVGPFTSAQEAGRWCSALKAAGGNCRVQPN